MGLLASLSYALSVAAVGLGTFAAAYSFFQGPGNDSTIFTAGLLSVLAGAGLAVFARFIAKKHYEWIERHGVSPGNQ